MAEFEDLIEEYEPPQIEAYEPPQVEAYQPPRKKKTAQRPTLPVEKRQTFTPKLPEQPFGKGSFRFETTPFRETPESYQLRSKEAPTGEERLRREEMLAAKRGERLKYARAATPQEAKELTSAQAEQDIYDKFGPFAYAARKGLFKLGKGLAEPFTQAGEEFAAIPGDTRALFGEGVEALGKRQEERIRQRQLEPDRYVIKGGYDPLKAAKAIESAVEIGGQLLFNPRAPRMVEGFRPPPDLSGGRPLRQLPPGPPIGKTTSYKSSASDPVPRYKPSETGFEFSIIPAIRPGKAPVMITPDWVFRALGHDPTDTTGLNIHFEEAPVVAQSILESSMLPDQKQFALEMLDQLYRASQAEDVNTISLLNHGFPKETLVETMAHETFHAGQAQASEEVNRRMFGNIPSRPLGKAELLFDPDWARNNRDIRFLLENNPDMASWVGNVNSLEAALLMAVELPAYIMEGTGWKFFDNQEAEMKHLFDSFAHVAERNGIEALDTIERVATIRPEMMEVIPKARSIYEEWKRSRDKQITETAALEPGMGKLSSAGSGLQGVEDGRVESRPSGTGTYASRAGVEGGGEKPGPIFYSQLEQFVMEKMPAKTTADQAMAMLKNPKYGVKEEEYNLSQLDTLLAKKAVRGEQVTKDELLDIIRTNRVEVSEKIYGQSDKELVRKLKADRDVVEGEWQKAYDSFHEARKQLNSMVAEEGFTQLGIDLETVPYSDRVEYRRQMEAVLRQHEPEFFQRYDQLRADTISLTQQMNNIDRELHFAAYQEPPHIQWKALKGGIPGSDREIVLKLPTRFLEHWSVSRLSDYEEVGRFKTEDEAQRFIAERPGEALEPPVKFSGEVYQSPHYRDVDNYVAHFRLNEMPPMEGKKTLAFQEGQSDLHQKGREEGYNDEVRRERLVRMSNEIAAIDRQMTQLRRRHENIDSSPLYDRIVTLNQRMANAESGGVDPELDYRVPTAEDFLKMEDERDLLGKQYEDLVGPIEEEMDFLREQRRTKRLELDEAQKQSAAPDLPFRQNWPDLIFKRLVRWAADNGYQRIVWPTGAMQIDLYESELRKNVDRIEYESNSKAKMIHDQPGAVGLLRDINTAQAEMRRMQDLSDQFWRDGDSASWREINKEKNEVENKIYDMKVAYRLSYGDLKFDSISEIYTPRISDKGIGILRAFKDGSQVLDKVVENEKWLDQHVGPKIAKTLKELGYAEGDDLSIGGQLHKFMYDQRYPQLAKEFVKKYGGQTGKTLVNTDLVGGTLIPDGAGGLVMEGGTPKQAEVHYIDISPKLSQEALNKGFRLFSKAKMGDIVKIKGYSAPAEVVGEGDEPGTMKVRFEDGTEDEFDVDDLKQKGKKMEDPMVGHLQKHPPTPPPDAGAEVFGPRSPLRVPTIATSYQESIANKFVELLIQEKLDVDITDPPSKQIYEALVSGDLRDDLVDQVLQEEGVSWEQFIQDQMQSYSKAGRDLGILSRLDRNLERMLKEDPKKFGRYVAPQKQVEVILRVLNRSVLGRSLWSRYGGLIQKMVLTKLTTALVNTRTTIARAAVDAASEGLGAWMQNMSEGKGKFWDRVKESKDEAVEAMAATYEVIKALNPNQLESLINGKRDTAYHRHQEIIKQVEKYFPEIHAKLFARPISGETQQRVDAEQYVQLANSLLPRVKNASTRRDMKNQLRVLERRLIFEKSYWGKATLRGPEIAYDVMLVPMQFAEFLFRRPKFIGRLRLELMDRGIDLDEVLRQTELTKEELEDIEPKKRMVFKDIPEEAIKGALNNTLELTYAYDPSSDKEAPVMERAAAYFIKTMNALGPGAILGELFPRAIYNGMKTLYEYSPAPFFTATPELMFGSRGRSPIAKILRPSYETDPKTGARYKAHPPTRWDWERLSKAMIGSLLLFVAWDMIRQGEVGDEWWQLGDPTKKDKEGQSTYYDVRRDRPFSEYFHLASLAERYRRGTIGDKQLGNELLEIYTGIRRTDASPDFIDTINAAGELFGATPASEGRKDAMIEAGGRTLAIPFTPILNLRDAWAIFSEEENRLKDTRGIWYGPIKDRFPYWRRSLPDLTSPIEPSPIQISEDPDLLMSAGIQLTEGPNFAGREWQRLGLNYKRFLDRDPDPMINRAQNIYFEREVRRLGELFQRLPYYMNSDDATKAALWESEILADEGIAAQARDFATLANPMEAERRKQQGTMPGPLQRKKYGLDKVLQGIREMGEDRRQ